MRTGTPEMRIRLLGHNGNICFKRSDLKVKVQQLRKLAEPFRAADLLAGLTGSSKRCFSMDTRLERTSVLTIGLLRTRPKRHNPMREIVMQVNRNALFRLALLSVALVWPIQASADIHTFFGEATCPDVAGVTETTLVTGHAVSARGNNASPINLGGMICLGPDPDLAANYTPINVAIADVGVDGVANENIACVVCHYSSPSMAVPALSLLATGILALGLIVGAVYRFRRAETA